MTREEIAKIHADQIQKIITDELERQEKAGDGWPVVYPRPADQTEDWVIDGPVNMRQVAEAVQRWHQNAVDWIINP